MLLGRLGGVADCSRISNLAIALLDRGMRRGIQAPELNSGDSPLSTQAPSFYGGVTLTAMYLQFFVAAPLPNRRFANHKLCWLFYLYYL